MSFSGRPTRSRVSSPFVPKPTNGAPEPSERVADVTQKKTFMDRWVEPARAPPRPSFAEAGFERGGTVANMAPLGTLPSSKVMKSAARAEFRDGADRVRRSEASNATTPETPDPQPYATRQRSLSIKPELALISPQTPRDQMSLPSTPQKMDEKMEEPVGEPMLEQEEEVAESSHSPLQEPTKPTRSSMSLSSPAPYHSRGRSDVFTPEIGPDGQLAIDVKLTDRVVEASVQKALDHQRYPTAYALRTLYDELQNDPNFIRLIESAYHERASEDELTFLEKKLRKKKREGKKDRTGEYYFNGDGSDPAPAQRPLLSTVSAALTYDTMPNLRPGSARSFGEQTRDVSMLSSASPVNWPRELDYFRAPLAHTSPYTTKPQPYTSIYGKPPASKKEDGPVNGASTPLSGHERSGSVTSSSSLSSMDDETLQSLDPVADGETADAENTTGNTPRRKGRGKRGAAQKPESEGKNRLAAGHRKSATSAPLLAKTNANAHNTRAKSDNSSSRNSTPAETLVPNGHKSSKAQPIPSAPPTKNKTSAPRTFTFSTAPVTSTSTSSPTPTTLSSSAQPPSTNNNNSSQHDGDMAPARLLPESVTTSVSSKSDAPTLPTFKTKSQGKAKHRPQDEKHEKHEKDILEKKRAAREKTNNSAKILESFERHQLAPPPPHIEEAASENGELVPAPAKKPIKKRIILNTSTRETRNRYNHNDSENSSPTLLSFQPDLAPGSLSNSRAGTPIAGGRPTRRAKTGSGLRVKTSPVKKKGGIVAGIPRASGERNSPSGVGAGPSESKDDNDDYCAACGGNGELVCCDGCNRAFHFKCVDPPMIENSSQDSWYCNTCDFAHNPPEKDESKNSTFGPLLHNLKFKNPSAFHLPKSIRECFEGVVTGAEGEYEEPAPPKPKNRGGYDEAPDYFRTKDSKGKLIVCHRCNGIASAPDRMIIPCSFCSLYWHLDCLDTPMAKEPHLARQWRCPAHVDDIMDVLPAKLGPAHRWRKLKGAVPVTPTIPRGSKNNGHIEIEESSLVDDENRGFYNDTQFGTVYKLPEEGLKLDFISKVKQQGGGISRSGYMNRQTSATTVPALHSRSLVEQQTALTLAALATEGPDLSIDNLTKTLVRFAPPEVMTMISQVDSSAIASKAIPESDRKNLMVVQEWIKNVLATSPATEVGEDVDDPDQPARKRQKTSNGTHEDEDATMLL